MTKKLSFKQKQIAKLSPPTDKIDSGDLSKLRSNKTLKKFKKENEEHSIYDQMLAEVLSKDAKAGDWIHDFVHSDNPKFKGKSKEKRKKMALAAYYAKQRNEEVETDICPECLEDPCICGGNHVVSEGESEKEFKARQERLAAAHKETQKDPKRLARLMKIPGYADAMKLAQKTTQQGVAEGWMSDDDEVSWEHGGRRAPTGAFRNPAMKDDKKPNQKAGKDKKGLVHPDTSKKDVVEEVEQIDELNKSTLGSYIKKASHDATLNRKIAGDFEHMADKARKPSSKDAATELASKYKATSWKRKAGVNKAVDRLAKEEAEIKTEGWEDMMKAVKDRKGPQPSGGSGKKEGSRYGGSKQKDKPEQDDDKNKMNEAKRPETDNVPFDPPYNTTSKPAETTDKSGAHHTPMSRAKHLARTAMKTVKGKLGKA